jgi:hypothetical protein
MKTFAAVAGAVFLSFSFSGCSLLKEKYARNEADAKAYLAANQGPRAKVNIEGVYWSPVWGVVVFNQDEKGRLTGAFTDYYTVDGFVTGRRAYMTLIDDSWREWSVELDITSRETIKGAFSPSIPFSEADKEEFVLTRIGS